MFGFSLDSGQHPPELITIIEEVKNLDSNKSSIAYRELRLTNVEDVTHLRSSIDDATLNYDNNGLIHYLNENHEIITSIFVSNVRIIKSKKKNVTLSGFVWHKPKGFLKAYEMFSNNKINQRDVWRQFRKDELQGWLVFALNNVNSESSQKKLKIEIDGNDFHNIDEFFCSLGEEINGIAGYFGRNIPALNDCMRGDFGVESIKELTWKHHQKSKKLFKTKFNEILEIFEDFDVKINLQ